MRLELLKPYAMSAKGDVLEDVAAPVAEQLIKRGVAKLADETKIIAKPFTKRIRKK